MSCEIIQSATATASTLTALDTGPVEHLSKWVVPGGGDAIAEVLADPGSLGDPDPEGTSKYLEAINFFGANTFGEDQTLLKTELIIDRYLDAAGESGSDNIIFVVFQGVEYPMLSNAGDQWTLADQTLTLDLADFGIGTSEESKIFLNDETFGFRMAVDWGTGDESFNITNLRLRVVYSVPSEVRPWGGIYRYNPCEPCCQPTYQLHLDDNANASREPADRDRRCGNCTAVSTVMLLKQSQATVDQLITSPMSPETGRELILQRAGYIEDLQYCGWCSRKFTLQDVPASRWNLSFNEHLPNQWTLHCFRYQGLGLSDPVNQLVFRYKEIGKPFECLEQSTFEFYEETGDSPKGIWGDDITVEPYWR